MKLKGAIIGCGFFAHNHMQAWNEIKNIEIVAVCDLDKKKAISFSKMSMCCTQYAPNCIKSKLTTLKNSIKFFKFSGYGSLCFWYRRLELFSTVP
mgnify:CR=1 FL=1